MIHTVYIFLRIIKCNQASQISSQLIVKLSNCQKKKKKQENECLQTMAVSVFTSNRQVLLFTNILRDVILLNGALIDICTHIYT